MILSFSFMWQWTDCMPLGRDLVRLLQYVARIPEIEKIWKDILHNPSALSPTFTGMYFYCHMWLSLIIISVLSLRRFSIFPLFFNTAIIIFRNTTIDGDSDIQKTLRISADARYGGKACVPHVKSKVWTTEAIPRLVPTTGNAHFYLSLVDVHLPWGILIIVANLYWQC